MQTIDTIMKKAEVTRLDREQLDLIDLYQYTRKLIYTKIQITLLVILVLHDSIFVLIPFGYLIYLIFSLVKDKRNLIDNIKRIA